MQKRGLGNAEATTVASRSRISRFPKRRGFWALVCAAAVVGATISGSGDQADGAVAASASKWTQTGADAAQSNRNMGERALTSKTLAGLLPDFSLSRVASFGECSSGPILRQVPVSDGTSLYYFDGVRVVSVSLANGGLRWRTPRIDNGGTTAVWSIAVSGGRVFVAGIDECYSASDSDSLLSAYSAVTGAKLWAVRPLDPPVRSMAVAGNRILVTGVDVNGDYVTASVNAVTGATQWASSPDWPAKTSCGSFGSWNSTYAGKIFVVGNVIPVTCRDPLTDAQYTAALSLATGAELWRKADGFVFHRGDGPSAKTPPNIYASDPTGHLLSMRQSGKTVWRSTTETGQVLAAGPSRIYVTCDTNSLCALDRLTGKRLWKAANVSATNVALVADVVYPSPGEPLNAATGASILLGQGYYDGTETTSVAVAAGRLWTTNGRSVDVYSLRK